MKRLTIFLIYLLIFVGCATTKGTPSQEFGGKPDVFCNVIQKPDPLLMGTWECRFLRTVGKSRPDDNYVKYRLMKQDDKYGLLSYMAWRQKKENRMENLDYQREGNIGRTPPIWSKDIRTGQGRLFYH